MAPLPLGVSLSCTLLATQASIHGSRVGAVSLVGDGPVDRTVVEAAVFELVPISPVAINWKNEVSFLCFPAILTSDVQSNFLSLKQLFHSFHFGKSHCVHRLQRKEL